MGDEGITHFIDISNGLFKVPRQLIDEPAL
jgi:hypothetical protein